MLPDAGPIAALCPLPAIDRNLARWWGSYWIPILIQHISKYKTNEKTVTCLKMTKQPLYFYPDIDIKVAG